MTKSGHGEEMKLGLGFCQEERVGVSCPRCDVGDGVISNNHQPKLRGEVVT